MSTRSRQLGNKYVKPEDIQNYIYDPDEKTNEFFFGEREEAKGSKNKGVLKVGVDKGEHSRESLRSDGSQERESVKKGGTLNASVEKWCVESSCSAESKLSNSLSEDEQTQKQVLVDCSEFRFNKGSDLEEKRLELNICEISSKDSSGQQHTEESSEEEKLLFHSTRKRPSVSVRLGIGVSKRSKMELDKEMTDTPAISPLKIELELEKMRGNESIKKRNLNAITEELDEIGKRWNDSYSRFKQSFQWGPRITKNCSEKWDFHYCPQKIFEAYQKRLEGNYSHVQGSRCGEGSYEKGDSPADYKISEGESNRQESEKVDEEGSDALDYEQYPKFPDNSNALEDDLHAYNSDGHSHMILRSSNHTRNRQDGRISNVKERYHDPMRQHQNEESLDSNKNLEDIKRNHEDYGSQMIASKSHYEENSGQGLLRMNDDDDDDDDGDDDDKVTCPICQIKFEKSQIETHANHCAIKTFPD